LEQSEDDIYSSQKLIEYVHRDGMLWHPRYVEGIYSQGGAEESFIQRLMGDFVLHPNDLISASHTTDTTLSKW
jgi:hypothetical protein